MTFEFIKELGFDVYMRDPSDSYCYFTDGKNIGYAQTERFGGYRLSTVHIPNKTTGTGFSLHDYGDSVAELTRKELESAFCIAPAWALGRDRESVVKWKDIDHMLNANAWNKGFRKQ